VSLLADASFNLYPEMTRKKVGTHLSEILKRSSTCAGGSKYCYKKVSEIKVVEIRKRKVLNSSSEEEASEEHMSEGSGGKRSRLEDKPQAENGDDDATDMSD
jgi:hypothetical protein